MYKVPSGMIRQAAASVKGQRAPVMSILVTESYTPREYACQRYCIRVKRGKSGRGRTLVQISELVGSDVMGDLQRLMYNFGIPNSRVHIVLQSERAEKG